VLVFNSGQQVKLTDSIAFGQAIEKFKPSGQVDEAVEYNKIIVPRGGEYNLVLADGTSVMINSDSKLNVPDRFEGKERRVRLEGEALFHVARDVEHPFIVETVGGDVTVLGTVFNVNAYSDEDYVQTTLVEGSVAFQGKGMADAKTISPGPRREYICIHSFHVYAICLKIIGNLFSGRNRLGISHSFLKSDTPLYQGSLHSNLSFPNKHLRLNRFPKRTSPRTVST